MSNEKSEELEVETLESQVMEHSEEEFEEEEDIIRAKILKRGAPPKNWDPQQLEFFEISHQPEIMALSQGLTIEEVLNFYGLTEGMLPDYDEFFFEITYIRGRMKAKQEAVQSLFDNMKVSKGGIGTNASLAYLTRFADSFKGDADGNLDAPKAIKIELVE